MQYKSGFTQWTRMLLRSLFTESFYVFACKALARNVEYIFKYCF